MREPVRGWVFDLDGVLINSEPIHLRAWQEIVRRRGGAMGPEWLQIGIGMTDIAFLARHGPALGFDPDDAQAIREKNEVFRRIADAEGIPLCPGADEALQRLRDAYPLAVATSSSRPYLDRALQTHGWDDIFQTALSRDDVSRPKPDPEIYLRACEGFGLPPQECVAIEDSPTGLAAARAAGLRTVGLTTHFSPEGLKGADLIEESLLALDRILAFTRVEG